MARFAIEELARDSEEFGLAIAPDRHVTSARHDPQLRVGDGTIQLNGGFYREEPVSIALDNKGAGADRAQLGSAEVDVVCVICNRTQADDHPSHLILAMDGAGPVQVPCDTG